ncbi:MAG: hypothetical protein NTZ26_08760 [Candidatus Aminicenantes bacterium]|nr:hypothetical protein [Candidatus Aminicenantes bacterium]
MPETPILTALSLLLGFIILIAICRLFPIYHLLVEIRDMLKKIAAKE